MCPDKVKGREVPNTLIQLRRTFQVGEQERQACYPQALVDVDCVSAEKVPECLVCEERLSRQEGATVAQKIMQNIPRDAHIWEHPNIGVVFECKAQRPRAERECLVGRVTSTNHHREVLAFLRRLTLYVDKLRRVCHRIEDNHELRWKMEGQERLLAGTELDQLKDD